MAGLGAAKLRGAVEGWNVGMSYGKGYSPDGLFGDFYGDVAGL